MNGAARIVAPAGQRFLLMGFTVSGYIVDINALADPARLRQLDLTVLDLGR